MNSPPDSLSRTLAAWRIAPSRDPQFRAAVWARIDAVRDQRWVTYVRRHTAACFAALAFAVVAGGWLGQWQAHRQAAQDREALTVAYLAELDARVVTAASAAPHVHH